MKDFIPVLKDRLVFFGWIAALILGASLLWSLTFPFRASCLMKSTNKILAQMEDPRRLSDPLSRHLARPVPMGCWFSIEDSDSWFFVFVIMNDGILIPCGAEIAKDGNITEILPLGNHARQVIDRVPQGLIKLYAGRIESAIAAGREG